MQHPIGYYSSSPYAQKLEGKYGSYLQDCPINRVPAFMRDILDQVDVGNTENITLLPFLALILIDRTTLMEVNAPAIEN